MNREDQIEIEIQKYCDTMRKLLQQRAYEDCEQQTNRLMKRFPHIPEPHNIYGIILEKQGEHLLALKHFRAALSLDPSFAPAIHNLETYATLFSHGMYAIDESDCQAVASPEEASDTDEDNKSNNGEA